MQYRRCSDCSWSVKKNMLLTTPISRYVSSLDLLRQKWSSHRGSRHDDGGNTKPLLSSLVDVFMRTWDLGFTAFGGPPVHFQILHARFVEGQGGKEKWVDEQTVRIIVSRRIERKIVSNGFHSIKSSSLSARVFPDPAVRR